MFKKQYSGLADMVCGNVKPIIHCNIRPPMPTIFFDKKEERDFMAEYVNKIHAEVVDTTDNVIVGAILREAHAQGVNDLFLIDREFIMTAIKNEMIRRKGETQT